MVAWIQDSFGSWRGIKVSAPTGIEFRPRDLDAATEPDDGFFARDLRSSPVARGRRNTGEVIGHSSSGRIRARRSVKLFQPRRS
jgi:hypothetical protein